MSSAGFGKGPHSDVTALPSRLATRYSLLEEPPLFELLLPEPFDSVFAFDPEKPPGVPAPRCTVVCLELSLS